MSNIVSGSLLLLVSVIFYISATGTEVPGEPPLDPTLWPRIILAVLSICGLLLIATSLKALRNFDVGKFKIASLSGRLQTAQWRSYSKAFLPFLLTFLYIYFLDKTGYFITTLVFCVLLMLSLGEKRLKFLISVPLVFVGLVWLLFVQVALIPLPMGEGPFRMLNESIALI